MLEESRSRMQVFTVFFNSINAFLFLLAFYQLLLSIQESLESSKWQIGVLRSMGMTKKQVSLLTLIEFACNILSATLIGFAAGYLLGVVTLQSIFLLQEVPS